MGPLLGGSLEYCSQNQDWLQIALISSLLLSLTCCSSTPFLALGK